MSEVYFLETDQDSLDLKELRSKIDRFLDFFDSEDRVALKMHFGERKSDTHLDPELVRTVYDSLESKVENCVLMDCTVLYKSPRAIGSKHKQVAKDNGFGFAPIIIADGEKGEKEMEVEIDGNIFDRVKLGKELENYDSLLSVAHFTGHDANGIGGALKNIGMGLGSKAGKMEMHKAFKLEIDKEKCVGCKTCIENCPAEAIVLKRGKADIDQEECIGCGSCIAVCPQSAVKIPWSEGSSEELQRRIDEYAKGVLKGRKSFFINVLFDITPDCDCVNRKQNKIVEDKGILISDDPVAIDQASLDLVGEKNLKSDLDPTVQIKYAEEIGLGEREYELKRI
ncbi:MAG: DUF362 domain-containing protein [Candidatus Aenigmatarchaeota archaeon]